MGTSLVCIQGDWSNIVDAKIKSRLASLAVGRNRRSPVNPLYARAGGHMPKPWGVSAIFAGYTGHSAALDLDWTPPAHRSVKPAYSPERSAPETGVAVANDATPSIDKNYHPSRSRSLVTSTRESAPTETRKSRILNDCGSSQMALNRQDPVALGIGSQRGRPTVYLFVPPSRCGSSLIRRSGSGPTFEGSLAPGVSASSKRSFRM